MKSHLIFRGTGFVLATGILALALPTIAFSQDVEPEKAHALLDKVKKTDLDRQIVSKETEIERLKQDQERAEKDASSLKVTMDTTAELIEDSSEKLTAYLTMSKKLEHDVAVTEAHINAERLKIEGLRALGAAQGKALSALNLHLDETNARSKVRGAEMELLQSGRPVPSEGNEEKSQSELVRWRKALSMAQSKTQTEERVARDAMKAASTKLAQAETRAATAKRLAEIDPTAPAPIAEKTTSKPKPVEKEDSEPVLRRAEPVRPAASVPSKPASVAAKPAAAKATPVATLKPAGKMPPPPLFSR